ncbi:MAG: hypothetical protein AAF560_33955 [Acidobacteriota bacterium]
MRLEKPELLILGLALALRLVLIQHATWVPFSDTRDYHVLAHNLAHGQGYLQVYEGEAAEYQGMTLRAFRMPGYPVLLASLYSVLGWEPFWAYLANVVFELLTLLLIGRVGLALFEPLTARIAQALFGLHVLWTPSLMTESYFTFLFTALIAAGMLASALRRTPSLAGAFGWGLLLAAAVFVRPIAIVAGVATVSLLRHVPLLRHGVATTRGRQRVALALLAALPLVAALGLWSSRNARLFETPVLLSTNLGSHNAAAFGVDRPEVVQRGRSQGLDEAAIDRLLRAEIGEAIRQAPWSAVDVTLRRGLQLFSIAPAWEVGFLREVTFAGPEGSPLAEAVYQALYAQYRVTYPLAALGLVVLAARRQLGGLGVVLIAFAAVHALVSDGNIRFAAPLYPIFCLLAGFASGWIWQRVRRRFRPDATASRAAGV